MDLLVHALREETASSRLGIGVRQKLGMGGKALYRLGYMGIWSWMADVHVQHGPGLLGAFFVKSRKRNGSRRAMGG